MTIGEYTRPYKAIWVYIISYKTIEDTIPYKIIVDHEKLYKIIQDYWRPYKTIQDQTRPK